MLRGRLKCVAAAAGVPVTPVSEGKVAQHADWTLASGLWDLSISVTFGESLNAQRHICGGREPGGESLFLTDGQRQSRGDRLVVQSFAPSCLTQGIMMWKRGGKADPTKYLPERQSSQRLRMGHCGAV